MKERPILFSAPMVRAILEGRKTQTRRVVKPQPKVTEDLLRQRGAWIDGESLSDQVNFAWQHGFVDVACPYGQPGDRLWGRETWGVVSCAFDEAGDCVDWMPDRPATPVREMRFGNRGYYTGHVIYAADGDFEWAEEDDSEIRSAWKPSIHMPRSASRIKLEITDVRVQRVQTISDEDALAEGINRIDHGREGSYYHAARTEPHPKNWCDPIDAFHELWDAINGMRGFGWNVNPWVWALTFKRVEQPA